MDLEKFDNTVKKQFDPNHSVLELNPELTMEYVRYLEGAIGHDFKVDGIIEIGSYSKGEAVPGSDIDTRVYVSSPGYFLWQTPGSRFGISKKKEAENKFSDFLQISEQKPFLAFDWFKFNDPAAKKISKALDMNVEFGLADSRFAGYELEQLAVRASSEHQFILESNPVYDPKGWLAEMKSKIDGVIYPTLISFYQNRYSDGLPFELYAHLKPHEMDKLMLEKSGQVQWVKWAVRSIRDAVGAKSYIQSDKLIYRKDDVLNYCSAFLPPGDTAVIEELYRWKTNPVKRKQMAEGFLANPDKYFPVFTEYTKKLENIVSRLKYL